MRRGLGRPTAGPAVARAAAAGAARPLELFPRRRTDDDAINRIAGRDGPGSRAGLSTVPVPGSLPGCLLRIPVTGLVARCRSRSREIPVDPRCPRQARHGHGRGGFWITDHARAMVSGWTPSIALDREAAVSPATPRWLCPGQVRQGKSLSWLLRRSTMPVAPSVSRQEPRRLPVGALNQVDLSDRARIDPTRRSHRWCGGSAGNPSAGGTSWAMY